MGLISTLIRAADGPNRSFDESDAFILTGAAIVAAGFVAHRIFIVNPAHRRDEGKRLATRSQHEMAILLARMRAEGAQPDWRSVAGALKQRGVEVSSVVLESSSANFGYSEALYVNELRRRAQTMDRKTRTKLSETVTIIAEVLPSAGAPEAVNRILSALRTS